MPAGAESVRRTQHSTWITLAFTGLVIGIAFVSVYVGLQRDPTPHRLPIAAVGTGLAASTRDVTGAATTVTVVDDVADGKRIVRRGDVDAVLSVSPTGTLRASFAGARGSSEAGAVQALAGSLAERLHMRLVLQDEIPLATGDSRGLASFYVVFGVTLSSFVVAQGLTGASKLVELRYRLGVITGFAITIGILAAAIAGPGMRALPASFFALVATLVLLSAASAFSAKALASWLGPVGNGVSVLVLTILGNATSGASIGYHLLPAWARALSPALPAGAAFRAITDFGYFGGHRATTSLGVLTLWAFGGLGLTLARHHVPRARHRAHGARSTHSAQSRANY